MKPALLLSLVVAATSLGCAPAIGDSCESSVDCSVSGDRICDIASPGGYCTVGGCDPDTCPDDAICVEFRFDPNRTAVTYCMQACDSGGDCRDDYACMGADDERLLEYADDPESSIARVTDLGSRANSRFCVAVP